MRQSAEGKSDENIILITHILSLSRQIIDRFQIDTYALTLSYNETDMYLISADLTNTPYKDKNQTIMITRQHNAISLIYRPEKIHQGGPAGTTIRINIHTNKSQKPCIIEIYNNEPAEGGKYNWSSAVWGWSVKKIRPLGMISRGSEMRIIRVMYMLEAAASATEFEMITPAEYYNI